MADCKRWSVDVHYFTLQPDEIDKHWGWIEPLLLKIEDVVWTPLEVKEALIAAEAQLWAFGEEPRGIVVTRLGKIGQTPTGVVWLAAGESIDNFTHFLRVYIEPWFRLNGCKLVELNGRKGWAKFLPDYRLMPQVTLAKEL